MSEQVIAEVAVWRDNADDFSEEEDQIVTISDESFDDTGRIQIMQNTNKGTVYLRVEPDALLQAILRLRFKRGSE